MGTGGGEYCRRNTFFLIHVASPVTTPIIFIYICRGKLISFGVRKLGFGICENFPVLENIF